MRSRHVLHLVWLFASASLLCACGAGDEPIDELPADAGSNVTSDAGTVEDDIPATGAPIERVAGGPIGDGTFVSAADPRDQFRFNGSDFATMGSSMQWVEGTFSFDAADGHCVFTYDSGVVLDDKYFLTTDGGSQFYSMIARRIDGDPGSNYGTFENVASVRMTGMDPITTTTIYEVRPDGYWSHYKLEKDGDRDYIYSGAVNSAATDLFFIEYGGADYVAMKGSELVRQ